MTVLLFIAHSFSRNPNFQPSVLYLGTFIIDLTILELVYG